MNPIPMILHCPSCGLQHIDAPDMHEVIGSEGRVHEAGWTNAPHRSHLCAGCGCIWRPVDVPTVGVASIATRGKDDNYPTAAAEQSKRPCTHPGCGTPDQSGPCAYHECPRK